MPFRISLSGLDATSQALDVTANNIANSNTSGFKTSRVSFADVFATGSLNLSSLQAGEGVTLAGIDQQFTQGNITQTGNNLDLAVSGQGFFTLHDASGYYYTRNGTFSIDRTGYVVNSSGQKVQVYPPVLLASANATTTTQFNTGALQDLQLNTSQSAPSASTAVNANLNLPANAPLPAAAQPAFPFNPTDTSTYNNTTSTAIYDSLGYQHTATYFFIKTAVPNQWHVAMTIDGTVVPGNPADPSYDGTSSPAGQLLLTFDNTGKIVAPANSKFAFSAYTPTTGAGPLTLAAVDLSGTTQYGNTFAVNTVFQDGYPTGQLTTINVDSTGIVAAKYTNGRSLTLGQLAISNFPNPQGLASLGHSNWSETYASGNVIRGIAGSSNIGLVQSGALETSNVDLTRELVSMITAQRAFQANAQMITTDDQITQTILQIK